MSDTVPAKLGRPAAIELRGKPDAGICAGGGEQSSSYRDHSTFSGIQVTDAANDRVSSLGW